jgi:hypothetical protein
MSRRLLPILGLLVMAAAVWRNRATLDALLVFLALGAAAGGLAAIAGHATAPLRARGIAGRMAAGGILILAMLVPLLVLILLGVPPRPA